MAHLTHAASLRGVVTAATPGMVARRPPVLRRPDRRLVFTVSTEEATGWRRARSLVAGLTGVAGLDGDGGARGSGGTPMGSGRLRVGLQHEEVKGKVRDNPIGDRRCTGASSSKQRQQR
jgi:hypothetical protein